jgi:F-type H+-transporting ATPase subunit gamma
MKSVGNTKKITAAMKMVAASKMRIAERVSNNSRGLVAPFVKILAECPGEANRLSPFRCIFFQ